MSTASLQSVNIWKLAWCEGRTLRSAAYFEVHCTGVFEKIIQYAEAASSEALFNCSIPEIIFKKYGKSKKFLL